MLIPNQRSAGLAIAFQIGLNAVKYIDGHDGSMLADMGLVLVLDFADIGDIGEQRLIRFEIDASGKSSLRGLGTEFSSKTVDYSLPFG